MSSKILWSINFIIGLVVVSFSLWYLRDYDPKFADDMIAEKIIPIGMMLAGFILPLLHGWFGTSAWYTSGTGFSCSLCLVIPYQWIVIQRSLAGALEFTGILFCVFTLLGILGALSGSTLRKMRVSYARKHHAQEETPQ